jgi:transposase
MRAAGCIGAPFIQGVRQLLGASVEVVKRNKLHTFAVMSTRRVVERSFAWLETYHRLWKNCERKLETSLQFVMPTFLALLLRGY